MRKKYLSALLFGALLVTSAGTFTSCKDYDDEINNLQEQIDVIKADLATLTETVKNLDGVKDMSFTDGKLVIETGNGKKVEVDIPSATGVAKIELKDNVLYVNDEPKGEVVIPEDKDVVVEVREDGKLYIDDQVQDLEIGSKVVMVDNGDYYTMTIDGKESYNLPKYNAAAELISLTLNGEYTFGSTLNDNGGNGAENILWGVADKAVESQGAKGNIVKGQLLVGAIAEAPNAVTVLPASFDLSAQDLELRDSKGNKAKVNVNAIAASSSDLVTGSRAADTKGVYNLVVEMSDAITEDNISNAFISGSEHVLYALFVNGVQYSDYTIAIKTADKKSTELLYTYDANKLTCGKDNASSNSMLDLKKGENKLEYTDAEVYDTYVTFEGTYAAMARELQVSANGMTITAGEKAQGTKELKGTLNIVLVDGTVVKGEAFTLNFDGSSIETPSEAETVTYKVDATGKTKDLFLKVDGLFANLSDAELEKVKNDNQITLSEPEGQNNFLFDLNDYTLYKADKKTKFNAAKDDLNELAYIKINDGTDYANDAEAGDYKLTLTVVDNSANENELIKINIPVKVTLPTFDELFTKTTKWVDGKLDLRLQNSEANTKQVNFNQAFVPTTGVEVNKISYEIAKVDNKVIDGGTSNGIVTLSNITNNDGILVVKALDVTATYKIADKAGLAVKSTFTTNIKSVFEDATLVYYVENDPQDAAIINGSNTIVGLTGNGNTDKYNGLAVKFGNYVVPIRGGEVLDNMTLAGTSSGANKVLIGDATVTGLADIDAEFNDKTNSGNGSITITGMNVNDNATLTIKFTDYAGIVNNLSIKIEKK